MNKMGGLGCVVYFILRVVRQGAILMALKGWLGIPGPNQFHYLGADRIRPADRPNTRNVCSQHGMGMARVAGRPDILRAIWPDRIPGVFCKAYGTIQKACSLMPPAGQGRTLCEPRSGYTATACRKPVQ